MVEALSSMVFWDREQPTRQDAVVVLAEQESVLESVVELDVSVSAVLDSFPALVVCSFSSSSSFIIIFMCFRRAIEETWKAEFGHLGQIEQDVPCRFEVPNHNATATARTLNHWNRCALTTLSRGHLCISLKLCRCDDFRRYTRGHCCHRRGY